MLRDSVFSALSAVCALSGLRRRAVLGAAFAILLLAPVAASADILRSNGSGDWSQPATWVNLSIVPVSTTPGPNDTAIIRANDIVSLDASTQVEIVDIQQNGVLEITDHGVILSLDILTVDGTLRGETGGVSSFGGKTVDVTPRSAGIFNVDVGPTGLVHGGLSGGPNDGGGSVFIHDTQGGDVPCPNGSSINVFGGTIEGGSTAGNVYLVAETVQLDGATVLGGSGASPFSNITNLSAAGDVYIAGVTVDVINNSLVQSGTSTGSPNPIGGSVKVLAWSCTGPGVGDATLDNSTIDVGGPSVGLCPGAIFNGANSTTTLGAWFIAPGSPGCTYWDPPLVELSGDGEARGDVLTIVADDLDARGLVTRTSSTPALEATDLLEIVLAPGGTLDLRGLQAGVQYFRAGAQIRLCADQDLILTDADAGLDELMEPAPELCAPQRVFTLDVPSSASARAPRGSVYEHPLAITNIGNASGSVKVTVSDSAGWLVGGGFTTAATLDAGEPWIETLSVAVPHGRRCSTEVKIVASPSSGPQKVSHLVVTAADCRG